MFQSMMPVSMNYSTAPSNSKATAPVAFSFRKRCERIDWRQISSVDVDDIRNMMDLNALQDNISNITFCNIDSELDMRSIDPNFVKLFKLSQLTIEYLLHCQDYLGNVISDAENKNTQVSKETDDVKKQVEVAQNEVEAIKKEMAAIKKESHKRKKLLTAQQQLIYTGAATATQNKCPHCYKAFISAAYMQSHVQRRHADVTASPIGQSTQGSQHPATMLNTTLERELLDIKERLRATELHMQNDNTIINASSPLKEKSLVHNLGDNKENIQAKPDSNIKSEVERLHEMYMSELKELSGKYEASQAALVTLQQRTGKPSNLGVLEDDVEHGQTTMVGQQEQFNVTEQVRKQISEMRSEMQASMSKEKRKWDRKIAATNKQHQLEIHKLEDELTHQQREHRQVKRRLDASATRPIVQEDIVQMNRAQRQAASSPTYPMQKSKQQHQRSESPKAKSLPRPQRQIETDVVPLKMNSQFAHTSPPLKGKIVQSKPLHSNSEDDDDDEDDDTGLDSLHTTGQSGQFTSSLPRSRLLNRLRQDPGIVTAMREEIKALLEDQLDKRGISPAVHGIDDKMLQTKQSVLRTERQTRAQKYVLFTELRQRLSRQLDQIAKEKLRSLKQAPFNDTRASQVSSTMGSVRSAPVSLPRSPPTRQATSSPARPKSHTLPKPVPRTMSPSADRRSPAAGHRPLQSMNSTGSTTEWTSTQWESEDEVDSAAEDEARPPPVHPREPAVIPTAIPRLQSAAPRGTKSPELDDDWDSDISDLEEVPMTKKPVPQKGPVVASIQRSIEAQLYNRSVKKPAGSVDTLVGYAAQDRGSSPDIPEIPELKDDDDDEDDIFSDVTSVEDDNASAVPRRPLSKPVSRSYGDTDRSSNTYGTSKWGSSSKEASTALPPGSGKSSVGVSLTDWDSDTSEI